MRKADLIARIADKTGVPKVDVLVSLEAFFKEVKDALHDGENVYIRGFGSFITKSLMICFLCKNSKLEVYPLIYCSFLTYTAVISYTLNEMKSHDRLSFAYFSIFAGFKIEDIHE